MGNQYFQERCTIHVAWGTNILESIVQPMGHGWKMCHTTHMAWGTHILKGIVQPMPHGQEICCTTHVAWVGKPLYNPCGMDGQSVVQQSFFPCGMGDCHIAFPMWHGEKVTEWCLLTPKQRVSLLPADPLTPPPLD